MTAIKENCIGYIIRDWELIDTKESDSVEELLFWYQSHQAFDDPQTDLITNFVKFKGEGDFSFSSQPRMF